MPKISVDESSIVALISGTGNVWRRRGAEYQDSTSKTFCLTLPKHSVGKSFSVALISGIENVEIKGGMGIKIFCQKLFVSQCRKFPEGNSLLLH